MAGVYDRYLETGKDEERILGRKLPFTYRGRIYAIKMLGLREIKVTIFQSTTTYNADPSGSTV
jgi:hypothetical protein